MTNPNKQKGTRAETKVRRFIEERCALPIRVSRRALSGSNDEGDLLIECLSGDKVMWSFVVEVKAGKQTANPNRTQLTEWMRQAVVEAENSKQESPDEIFDPVLVVVRYNRKLKDAEVYMPMNFFRRPANIRHLYLDEFAEYLKRMGIYAKKGAE